MTAPQIELGAWVANPTAPSYAQTQHYVEEIDGWDSPDVRGQFDDRTNDMGVVPMGLAYGGRPMTLIGWSVLGGADTLTDLRATIARTFDLVSTTGLLIVRENPDKQVEVYRHARIRQRPHPGGIRWEVPLMATDPRKLGTTEQTQQGSIASGQTSATINVPDGPGDAPTRPTIDYTAASTANEAPFTFAHGGLTVATGGGWSLSVGQTLTVDFEQATLFIDGGERADLIDLDATRWWDLSAAGGAVTVTRNTTAGVGNIDVRYREAWL